MVYHTPIVRSEVTETSFGFYTSSAIRNLSACHIVSPVARDALGNVIAGGLYDSRLGCTEMGANCPTCGLNYVNCPGHCGHIELDVPVYHPMLFLPMFNLLKSKCAYCHRFRASEKKCRVTLIKIKLLEMGEITNALNLDDLVAPSLLTEDKDVISAQNNDVEGQLRIYEERYEAFLKLSKRPAVDPYHKTLQTKAIDQFMKSCIAVSKCENCGAISPKYRKDGYSKIFQRPLSQRVSKAKAGVSLKSGLEALRGDEDNIDVASSDDDSDDDQAASSKKPDKYLVPIEVEAQIKLVWLQHKELLDIIWSRAINNDLKALDQGWEIFFIRACLVPASRFRPASQVGGAMSEHPQTINLAKIMEINERIRTIQLESKSKSRAASIQQIIQMSNEPVAAPVDSEEPPSQHQGDMSKIVTNWIALQNALNCYMDSSKDPNILANQAGPAGIRQILERKEGLFRKNMMGKRVNYCCRSVISPDPYIGVNEIGIPVKFARTLHYPTPVNDWNVKYLRSLVERGPFEYPGANQIETPEGKIIKLDKLSLQERKAKAKLLLASPGMKVYRHLIDGDVLLVNRQPTLHKPGIMAHKARILKHVREQTLRMNYANCNAYNADFDGDEINCHFVQNELARAEAYFIANTDNQYIVPTSGNPLRGLIQDHVASAVKLSCKECFLTKQEFQQILFVGVCGLPGTEIVGPSELMITPRPAIMKPVPMWTGKQVFSSLLAHICRPPLPSLNLDGKARTPPTAFGVDENEHIVVIRRGELLCGVMDKAAIGNSSLGLVHAVYELYGSDHAGRLLSALGRMLTFFLQDAGMTCGVEDLTLTLRADKERNKLLQDVNNDALKGLSTFLTSDAMANAKAEDIPMMSPEEMNSRLHHMLATDRVKGKVKLDGAMQGVINQSASKVIKSCLPSGLERPFLRNNFTLMVSTGAKGSGVNQSQITCFLGQQALEGQRVPMMVSGKTLPSFRPYDPSPRAGGFVRDRFLTGVKPQEYFFHCMAGREGLVDTAVKTSRSGYLQRCLMKHLEDIKVHYDMTVRDSGGNIVQFLYGEDGIDTMSSALLRGSSNQMSFLARNNQAFVHKYNMTHDFFNHGLEIEPAQKYLQNMKTIKNCLQSMKSKDLPLEECLETGSVVYARRKINPNMSWIVGNIMKKYFQAEVMKIRQKDSSSSSSSSSSSRLFDIKYEDGTIEKKVPMKISHKLRSSSTASDGHSQEHASMDLITIKLPDPIMSVLGLGSNVGCISENVQDAILKYIRTNPDEVITATTSNNTITKESFELLVWVKYMRSLACPGEAVGCVAAQSVGEPSTQMTLNTFHLAGHGGANVTLGIPRLREIIMTASKSQKTPTMLVPINYKTSYQKTKDLAMTSAKMLSRKLCRLPLSMLLHHEKGIEVGEVIEIGRGGFWERSYRILLTFQNPKAIDASFDLPFPSIIKAVKDMFMAKLSYYIKSEQRRAGDKTTGRHDPLSQFRSSGGGDPAEIGGISSRRGARKNGDDDEENEKADTQQDDEKESKRGKDAISALLDSEDEEDDDDADESDEDEVMKTKSKERGGYEDDEDEDNEELTTQDGKKSIKKGHSSTDHTDIDDDDSNDPESDDENDKTDKIIPKSSSSSSANAAIQSSDKSTKKSSNKIKNEEGFLSDEKLGKIEFKLSFPAIARRLLMVQIVEKSALATTVRATKNISNAYSVPHETKDSDGSTIETAAVQTEGVNFEALWSLPSSLILHNEIKSNDIWSILQTYGIEAARQSIVSEINGVFGVYGIDVNPRHLSLIADFMTRTGSYHAMNRIGMHENSSPLLQMSFETTCSFLLQAAQEGRCDNQESPTARIVLGNPPKIGTGCFDLMVPIQEES